MQNYVTSYNQNITDVCLIVYGTLDKLVYLMFQNNISFATKLATGTNVVFDDGVIPSQLRFSTGF